MSQEVEQGKMHFIAGNYRYAFRELLPAAVKGNLQAEYAVGYMYYYGYGTSQDTDTGIFWMQKAAAQNFEPAVKALGIIHHKAIAEREREKNKDEGYLDLTLNSVHGTARITSQKEDDVMAAVRQENNVFHASIQQTKKQITKTEPIKPLVVKFQPKKTIVARKTQVVNKTLQAKAITTKVPKANIKIAKIAKTAPIRINLRKSTCYWGSHPKQDRLKITRVRYVMKSKQAQY